MTSSVVLSMGLLGCGSSDSDAEESSKETAGIKLALIPKTSSNLVFGIGNDGAQFAARDLARTSDTKIDVEFMASPKLDPKTEQALVRKAIEAKKDGLIISCVDDTVGDAIDEAVEAGIAVMTYDSDCADSKRLGFYSMQSEVTGTKAADLLASAMGSGKKTVAILTGRAGADNLERRVGGFSEQLEKEYPDISVVKTVNCEETAESCSGAVEDDIVDAYPDLDGLLIVGLWGILEACTCSDTAMTCVCEDNQMPKWKTAAKGKLKTVAYDSLPFELALVEQGYISALIGQKYFDWGYSTVGLMFNHLAKGKKIAEFNDSGFDVVCANNSANMSAKWLAADFREELSPKCDL